MQRIERIRAIIERAIARTDSTLDYPRTIAALELLANTLDQTETDENVWYLGEYGYDLGSIIVGSYWHLSEWHGGMWSDEYRTLCTLGKIFDPGMTAGPEPDSVEWMVYKDLERMAS